ncbi:hypothetical protein HmCmsJML015_03680 [Escherichia coli]|nr:hypothetical protein HmCmsJML015_03680 [Escherichia coli]
MVWSQFELECCMQLHRTVGWLLPAADGQQCSDRTTSQLQKLPGQ